MKKAFLLSITAIIFLLALIPVNISAAPNEEVWQCFSAGGGEVYMELTINVSNLKTSQFRLVNNSTNDVVYFFIYDPRYKTLMFPDYMVAGPGETIIRSWAFNYQRQTTDPDSPPIRMPPNTNFSFGTGSPADNGIS